MVNKCLTFTKQKLKVFQQVLQKHFLFFLLLLLLLFFFLPSKHLGVLENSLKRVRAFQMELEFEKMLLFEERGKPEYPEKNLSRRGREPRSSQIRPHTIIIILFDFELVISFNPQNESTYVYNPIFFIFLGSLGRIRPFWILQALKHAL